MVVNEILNEIVTSLLYQIIWCTDKLLHGIVHKESLNSPFYDLTFNEIRAILLFVKRSSLTEASRFRKATHYDTRIG